MKFLIAGTLVAFGLALATPAGAVPLAPSPQAIAGQSDQMIMQVGGHGGRGGHGNRGRHLGWSRGHHYGWAHNHHRRH